MDFSTDFKNTAAALEEFDAAVPARIAELSLCDLKKQAGQKVADIILDEIAGMMDVVSRAFFEDTKEINTLENCLKLRCGIATPDAEPTFIRKCVAEWRAAQQAVLQ